MRRKVGVITRWRRIVTDLLAEDGVTVIERQVQNIPELGLAAGLGVAIRDVTAAPAGNLPPRPNILIVEVECEEEALAALRAHPAYGDASILWVDNPRWAKVVTEAQYNALVAFLVDLLNVTDAAARKALGGDRSGGRTRGEIARIIIQWAQSRPKA